MHDDRIRVLFFLPALVAGGAERVMLTLLRNLSRERFDITLAVVTMQDSVFTAELPPDVPLIDLKSPRLRYALPKIVSVLWKEQPDIVFSTLDYFNATLGATRQFWPRHTRFVARPTILFSAALARQSRPGLWRSFMKLALFNTDLLVFQSPEMEQDYHAALGWRRDAGMVIPNPLDFGFVREQAASRTVDTGLDPSCFNLVASGRLEDQKGFDVAIDAVSLAGNDRITLTVLGDGSLRSELERRARDRKVEARVRFVGYQDNPYPYYAQADGFLLSSRFEGFPNVVLEALSCGTAVVSTPVAGLRSLFEGIPECRLADGYDAPALASALDRFAEAGRRRVAEAAVERFDVRHVVRDYEALLAKAHERILPQSGEIVLRNRSA